MDKSLIALLKSIPKDKREDIVKLAGKAETKEQVLELAKKVGIDVSDEQAESILKAFSEKAAVSDDDLDKVSGGSSCFGQC